MTILDNKVALVTGSSRGIGAAIARLFAQKGAKVVVHRRDQAALSAVQAEIEHAGGKVMSVVADVTRFGEIEAMRQQIERTFGPIDILVANAGGSPTRPGLLEEISEEGWRASVDANLTTTFLTIKSILPGMKERKAGNIITLSSAAARRPHPGSPIPYAVAKNAQGIPETQKQALVEAHPVKRLGTPEDVARAALFLASDEAAWITGVILDVAGGSVMV